MANASRTQRRKEERERRKATKQVPPAVKARIAEIQRAGGSAALSQAPPPPVENGDKSPPTSAPPPPPSPADDLPPGIPQDLPPEIAAAVQRAQAAMGGGETGAGGDTRTAPKGGGVSKARTKRFTDLEGELAILLTLPGPFFEGAGDQYCATHFMIQGPMLAGRLVAYAETNPATAQLLERIVAAGGFAVVAMAIFSYALPPMLHHGLPAPEGLKKMYHVPAKDVVPPEDLEGAPPEEGAQDGA